MALDLKATSKERFKTWLAEQEADLVPLPRRLRGRYPIGTSPVLFLVCLLFWVVALWSFSSGVRKLLCALQA